MRFHFVLQPALDSALARERACVGTLAAARCVVLSATAAVAMLAEAVRDIRARPYRSGTPATVAIDCDRCLDALAAARRRRLDALDAAEAGVAAAENRYRDAHVKRAGVERLRARRYAAFTALEALREASDYDESNARFREAGRETARTYAS